MTEAQGTFACPICGVESPHSHSEATQAAYREEQISGRFYGEGDGWIRTELHRPKERGWYLCLGVEIDADQFGKPKDIWERHDRWSQLSWFKWVRQGGARGHLESDIPEVLYYDPFYGGWQLRNLLGNAVYSGAENRHRVQAEPKYWRELPPFIKRGTSEMGRETANDPDRGKTFVTGLDQPK